MAGSRSIVLGAFALSAVVCLLPADERKPVFVGLQPDGSYVVPTNQVLTPAGKQVSFAGRPVDLVLDDSGQTLIVKNLKNLLFLDVATARVKQVLDIPDDPPISFNPLAAQKRKIAPTGKGHHYPTGFSVVGLLLDGEQVYVSDSKEHVHVATRQPDGSYRWSTPLELLPPTVEGDPYPTGIARLSNEELWVCSSRGNSVQILDRAGGDAAQVVPVGVAPYMIVPFGPDKCYVTNWGGDRVKPGEAQALSSGTPVRINPATGIVNSGTVSVLVRVPGRWKQSRSIHVGLHPSGMALSPRGKFLYVANANSDTVSVIATEADEVVETILCKPEAALPFGSGANAVAVSPDGSTLYVANGSNNCIAVVRLGSRSSEGPVALAERSSVVGLIPTAWYPGAVTLSKDGRTLLVANVKGVGSLSQPRPVAEGKNTHDFLGTVSIIDVPDARQLARYTLQVNRNNRLAYSRAGLDPARPGVKPVPVPERHGEPSVFKHVIYVIKENRSYDQILGDMKEGNGDPNLVLFGEEVTPNQHALARQFTLFDNFYCSGALSATGHQWISEAYVTDYLEKAFGGFTRSYPVDGDDALAFASSGFLWGHALARGRTLRNYGEFVKSTYTPADATWTNVYRDYQNRTKKVRIDAHANVAPLRPHTHPHYPGFPLTTPDVYRAQLFLDELREFEKKGELPNLLYVFLPANHSVGTTPGFPTPRAMVADNDVALGRIVEAVSKSKFWPQTCIFVVEDDPQFGLDHVDGHRSVAQAISPYTRRKYVDSTNCNQTGMVKTIELILGLPPMNQLDLSATAMRGCFQEAPDLTPYTAVPNRVPLDEMNPPLSQLQGKALYWAKKSLELSFDKEDEADEDTFNRILWHATRGYEVPYPTNPQR